MNHREKLQHREIKHNSGDMYDLEKAGRIDELLAMDRRNPNNCATCDYKQHPDGGWCYMFREAPQYKCMRHTAQQVLHERG